MTTPKNHHYLPESYLVGFTRNGTRTSTFSVFDRKMNEFRSQTPQDTCVERYYYSVEEADGERSPKIEKGLGQIEGVSIPILLKLAGGQAITSEERETFALFVAVMHFRGPRFARTVQEVTDQMYKFIAKFEFDTPEKVAKAMERVERETGAGTTTNPNALFEYIHSHEYDVIPHRNFTIETFLHASLQIANFLRQMSWIIAHSKPESSFVTSDTPVILVPPEGPHTAYSGGFISRGTVKVFPLSSSACLFIGDRGDLTTHVQMGKAEVRETNINMAMRCERFVISRDEALLKSIVHKSRVDTFPPGKTVVL